MRILYFHRWELIENLLKFTSIWELKLTNFNLGSKIYESYILQILQKW